MEEINKVKYRIVMAALEKSETIEQAMSNAEKLLGFIFGEKEKPAKERSNVGRPKKLHDKDRDLKILEAMIAMKESGYKPTAKRAAEMAFPGQNLYSSMICELTASLVNGGYLKRTGRAIHTKWTILKNPDGTPYKPKILKVPAEEAQGYGWTQKLGDVATVKHA